MKSFHDEDLKQIKEIYNDDLKQNDIETINYVCFEEQFDSVSVKILQFKYILYLYHYQQIII